MRGRRRNSVSLAKPERAIVVEATKERFAMAGADWERANMDIDNHEVHDTVRMLDKDPLESLAKKGAITGHQHRAGLRLQDDFHNAGLDASGVVDPTREIVQTSPTYAMADNKLAALQRFNLAMKRVRRQHVSPLNDIVLFGQSLVQYGRARTGYKSDKDCRAVALHVLREALSDLDKVYHGETRGIRHGAHVDDYRPSFPLPGD